MDAELARFLRDELGAAPEGAAGPWVIRGPMRLWQGGSVDTAADTAPAKGAWYFLTIVGDGAGAIRAAAASTAAWGSLRVEVTIGQTTWRTSLFPSKAHGGWLLPIKAAVRKSEKLTPGSVIEASIAIAL